MSRKHQILDYHKKSAGAGYSAGGSENTDGIIVLSLLAFILFVVSVPKYDITAVMIYAAFPVFAIAALGVPVKMLVKWLFMISPFIIIMAAANPILDQRPFTKVGDVSISAGFVSGIVIAAKSIVTLSAVITFSFCIHFHTFCKVLRSIYVPEVFVTQLLLLYRYSFLLADEAAGMMRARNMRSFGRNGKGIFVTARLIGSLLLRTTSRAERIYRAMVARGFDGEFDRHNRINFRVSDILMTVLLITIFTLIRIIF